MNLKEKAAQLKTDLPALFLALKRKDTPIAAKILAGLTLAYALSPIDLIPDFIPVLGYLDDIIILPVLVVLTIKLIPKAILDECRAQAESLWAEGKPKKWYFAVPIVLVWTLIIFFIVRAVLSRT
ncbi:MAG: YkvA family protein [Eubacteriales bacterium]